MSSSIVTLLPAVVGVSLTAVMLRLALSLALLTAVLPPKALGSVVPPAVPVVLSQARKVMEGLPLAVLLTLALGTKRMLSVASSRRAALPRSTFLPVVALKAVHAPPPILYCHTPRVLSTLVTAMALGAVAGPTTSTSVMLPLATRADTRVPVLLASGTSSAMLVKAGVALASSTGASLTALTVSVTVAVPDDRLPSLAV